MHLFISLSPTNPAIPTMLLHGLLFQTECFAFTKEKGEDDY